MRGDTSGNYQHCLLSILRGQRDESRRVDLALAKDMAAQLYQAGEGRVRLACHPSPLMAGL